MKPALQVAVFLVLIAGIGHADPVTAGVLRLLGTLSAPGCSSRPVAVASTPLGGTMVAWLDATPAGTIVSTTLLDGAGAVAAGPFLIATLPPGRSNLTLAASGSGYLLAWEAPAGGAVADSDVFLMAFDTAGAGFGPAQIANTLTALNEGRPDAAAIPGGGYLVGWIRYGAAVGGTTAGVWLRRFGPTGAPIDAAEVRADAWSTNTGWQDAVAVGAWPGGGYFAAWQDGTRVGLGGLPSPDGNGTAILGQWLDAALAPVGSLPLLVNTITAGDQLEPRLDMDARGRAVLAWRDSQALQTTIRYQSVSALGGPAFSVELPIVPAAVWPSVFLTSVACDPGGGFAAAYTFKNAALTYGVYTGPCGGGTPGYGVPAPPPAGFTRFPGAGLAAFESIAFVPIPIPPGISDSHTASEIAADAFGNLVSVQLGDPASTLDVAARRYARNQIAFAPPSPAPGTTVAVTLDTPAGTGDTYIAAASATAGPSFIGARPLRLGVDPLFLLSLTASNPFFSGFVGPVAAAQTAGPAINIPSLPALSGVRVWLAYVTGTFATGEVIVVSDSAPLDIL